MTPVPPVSPRAVSFIDGQNLFYAAKEAFGYSYPNYDPLCLSRTICQAHGWNFTEVRFYTGVPDTQDDPFWHHFWTAKLAQMGRLGVHIFSRPLRYRNQTVTLPDGTKHTFLVGQEKGVDVRLALDIVRLVNENEFDVCLILSQDQDLTEAVDEVKEMARKQNRWIKVACAFPSSPASRNRRGIDKTDWIRIERAMYDTCLDHRDYRPKRPG
jgi:uncharacterized LabA/DUF88 family protein